MVSMKFVQRIGSLCLIPFITGCSSLGISLFPSGHFLTDQASSVIECSPTRADLPRELDQTVLRAHYLQPGDTILIEPVKLDSEVRFPADQKVLADGSVDLNAYGRVIVAGLTLEAAEELVQRIIVDGGAEYTQVNVRLLEPVHRYYVLGEVASPGSYPLTGYESVLDGIIAAGGLTSESAPCKIVLSRPTAPTSCRVALPICYNEISQLGDTSTNYQLQPGDRIFIASRSWIDELMFWRANDTCQHCCACQSACADSRVADFQNPISPYLPASPAVVRPGSSANANAEDLPSQNQPEGFTTPNVGLNRPDSGETNSVAPGELKLPDLLPLNRNSRSTSVPQGETRRSRVDGELEFDEAIPEPR